MLARRKSFLQQRRSSAMALQNIAGNTCEGAAQTCAHLTNLRAQSLEIEASQEGFRRASLKTEATLAAQDAALRGLRTQSVGEIERKLEQLTTMAKHVTTAADVLETHVRTVSQQRRHHKRQPRARHAHRDEGPEAQAAVKELEATVAGLQRRMAEVQRAQDAWDAEWGEMYAQLDELEARAAGVAALQASIVE